MPLQQLLVVKLSDLHIVYSYSPAPLEQSVEFHLWQSELASILRKTTFDSNFSTFYCESVLVCVKRVGSLLFLLTGDPLDDEFACKYRVLLRIFRSWVLIDIACFSVRYSA